MVSTEKRIERLRKEARRKPELCIERAVLFTKLIKRQKVSPKLSGGRKHWKSS